MSSPGWYPDPSGQPKRFRFWDGRAWSEQTTDNPYLAPPPGAQPPMPPPPPAQPPTRPAQPPRPPVQEPTRAPRPPMPSMPPEAPTRQPPTRQLPQPPYHQPTQPGTHAPGQQPPTHRQWSPTPEGWTPGGSWTPMSQGGAPASGGGRRGLWVALGAVLLVLLLIGGVVAGVYAINRDDDGDGAGDANASETTDDESDVESDDPTEADDPTEGSTGPLESCPVGNPLARKPYEADGRVHGGGLSFTAPRGYAEGNNVAQFEWMYDVNGVEKVIERTGDSGWISMMVVGELRREDGYTSPEQAALSLVNCMAGSPSMYASYASDEELSSEGTTVQGREAWEVRQEIRIDDAELEALGDTAVVIVVDNGSEETFSVFAGVVPIGNEALLGSLDRAAAGLVVE